MRKLRFIRSLIAKRRHYDIDEVDEESECSSDDEAKNAASAERKSLDLLFPLNMSPVKATEEDNNVRNTEIGAVSHEDHLDVSPVMSGDSSYEREQASYNKKLQQRIDYFKDVFGAQLDEEGGLEMEKTLISHALAYGPEQAAVYSREFAQGAAACCPNGCREERLHTYSLKELEELEEEIVDAVEQSFYDLTEAQDNNMQSERIASVAATEIDLNKGLPKVKSVEDMKVPAQYDVECELFSRTPTKFKDGNDGGHLMVSFRSHKKIPVYYSNKLQFECG